MWSIDELFDEFDRSRSVAAEAVEEVIHAGKQTAVKTAEVCDPCQVHKMHTHKQTTILWHERELPPAKPQLYTKCCQVLYLPEIDRGRCHQCKQELKKENIGEREYRVGQYARIGYVPQQSVGRHQDVVHEVKAETMSATTTAPGSVQPPASSVEPTTALVTVERPKTIEIVKEGEGVRTPVEVVARRFPRDLPPQPRDWKLVLVTHESEGGQPRAVYMKMWSDGSLTDMEVIEPPSKTLFH